jgi:hypothetical protein
MRRTASLHQRHRPYYQQVKGLCSGNPNLEYLEKFMSRPHRFPCRVRVVDFDVQSNNHIKSSDIFDSSFPTKFEHFLEKFHQNPPHRRLFIVEDLIPEVIEALGCRFNIDPAFIASHISVSEKSGDGKRDRLNAPRLPSLCDPHEQFHLKYWEVFTIDTKTWAEYTKRKARDLHKEGYKLQNADTIRLDFNVYRNIWLEPSDEQEEENGNTTKDMVFGLSR